MKFHFIILLLFLFYNNTNAQTNENSTTPTDSIYIEYYFGNGCPQCSRIHPYILTMQNRYPKVVFKKFEIYDNRKNLLQLQKRFKDFEIPFKYQCIPAIFFEDKCFTGYKGIRNNVEAGIKKRLALKKKKDNK